MKHKKPFGWWFHKFLCAFWYGVYGRSNKKYYYHLNKLLKYGFNYYGEKTRK